MNADLLHKATGMPLPAAKAWTDHIDAALTRASCLSPLRVAMFLAQVGHESGLFTRLVESLNYTPEGLCATWPSRFTPELAQKLGRVGAKPANQLQIGITAYGGRMGNGVAPATDGHTYRGRGLIQVTGRNNYAKVGATLNLDLVATPALLEQPQHAAASAAVYWLQNNLNAYADKRLIVECSAAINTGNSAAPEHTIKGLAERRALYERACRALGV